ncbi:MAG TPA: hypothetical protein VKR06_14460 [Ktedonosporobacter sp.]|nr:hypothetical protein [Ktedonosporobacter sp.]
MKRAILIIAAIVLLGGVIHIGLGLAHALLVSGLTLDVLWFTSAGLALICIACINYLVITIVPGQTRFFVPGHITNILGSILLGLILLKLPAPHVALLFILLVAETVLIIWSHIKAVHPSASKNRKALSSASLPISER